jgi:hypothetical protein
MKDRATLTGYCVGGGNKAPISQPIASEPMAADCSVTPARRRVHGQGLRGQQRAAPTIAASMAMIAAARVNSAIASFRRSSSHLLAASAHGTPTNRAVKSTCKPELLEQLAEPASVIRVRNTIEQQKNLESEIFHEFSLKD